MAVSWNAGNWIARLRELLTERDAELVVLRNTRRSHRTSHFVL
jgi:hypothetical protein